ncbi:MULTISPECIES: sulfate ABC transporter substrate-binding protein [Leptospira]|uniref:ABC transporter permease n=1 Tax=Leptospira kirschneri serovar Pomona TaxID=561005 RepID=A0A1T1E2K0_9LEPT|nr:MULTISPECIES: sulfate ABC transporter substrate-binding protein [Leptospira]EMO77317.1 sulfate-binding protein [Leptospira kirschneri str. 200801925]EKQ84407.1 sulfate-binding protein [Leptospira kirschneri serovar Grippotyphosa str. Moskva]EMJ99070.1 sulfate-binding protein [Leptospira kirschneri str. MMD1493]EMN25795.1 sulfate-binding protein [Leptospira kirschneri serovar Sokoine str. RM1]EMO66692.1 sulfate-binding protein [Leptospira kirschneri str. 200803703]
MKSKSLRIFSSILCFVVSFSLFSETKLLNVSYDPTRELYSQINKLFIEHWKKQTGEDLVIHQSHGGSGKQARAVIDGLEADVVTLALAHDIETIAEKTKLLSTDWEKLLPYQSSPYTSTIVFLVRKGNPKGIKDWDDLVKPGIGVVTPNPKTGGGARWNYLAAWGYAKEKYGSEEKAKTFMKSLYSNVLVLDSGARGSLTTFVQRGIGDVLISWENEAHLALQETAKNPNVEIVFPSVSILAEPSVAVVTKNAEKHNTLKVAENYLKFLYSSEGQETIAKNYYRPTDKKVASKYKSIFKNLKLFTIRDVAGSWKNAQEKHFSDGAIFDQITSKR